MFAGRLKHAKINIVCTCNKSWKYLRCGERRGDEVCFLFSRIILQFSARHSFALWINFQVFLLIRHAFKFKFKTCWTKFENRFCCLFETYLSLRECGTLWHCVPGYLWLTRWWGEHVCWPSSRHSCHHPSRPPGLQQRFPQIMSPDIWAECKCNYPRWTFLVTPTLAGRRGVKQLNLGPNLCQIFVWHRSEWGQCV